MKILSSAIALGLLVCTIGQEQALLPILPSLLQSATGQNSTGTTGPNASAAQSAPAQKPSVGTAAAIQVASQKPAKPKA